VEGTQYVAVMAGWGGAFALVAGDAAAAAGVVDNRGRLLVWKLGGTATLPPQQVAAREIAALPAKFDAALVTRGNQTFHRWCATCHGVARLGRRAADLRGGPGDLRMLDDIVLGRPRDNGMPR
jgi:mono/diheme cytochrome c family protein